MLLVLADIPPQDSIHHCLLQYYAILVEIYRGVCCCYLLAKSRVVREISFTSADAMSKMIISRHAPCMLNQRNDVDHIHYYCAINSLES